MTVIAYTKLCYNEVRYKWTALYKQCKGTQCVIIGACSVIRWHTVYMSLFSILGFVSILHFVSILCTISLAISYVSHLFVFIFVQYRTISIAMTRTDS